MKVFNPPILSLPPEVISLIGEYLDIFSLLSSIRVCKILQSSWSHLVWGRHEKYKYIIADCNRTLKIIEKNWQSDQDERSYYRYHVNDISISVKLLKKRNWSNTIPDDLTKEWLDLQKRIILDRMARKLKDGDASGFICFVDEDNKNIELIEENWEDQLIRYGYINNTIPLTVSLLLRRKTSLSLMARTKLLA